MSFFNLWFEKKKKKKNIVSDCFFCCYQIQLHKGIKNTRHFLCLFFCLFMFFCCFYRPFLCPDCLGDFFDFFDFFFTFFVEFSIFFKFCQFCCSLDKFLVISTHSVLISQHIFCGLLQEQGINIFSIKLGVVFSLITEIQQIKVSISHYFIGIFSTLPTVSTTHYISHFIFQCKDY